MRKDAYGRACKSKPKKRLSNFKHHTFQIHIFEKKSLCWKSIETKKIRAMTAKGYHKRTLERPYGLEMAVEVEKGWEMNPRAPIILGIIKAVSAIRFQCNHPPKLERGHHGRLLTYQLTYFSTEFTLELSNPQLWQLLFPTISPLEGNFNPYVSDPFTPNTSQCYIERAGKVRKIPVLLSFSCSAPSIPTSLTVWTWTLPLASRKSPPPQRLQLNSLFPVQDISMGLQFGKHSFL